MNPQPIIFLAFANDKEDNARHLRHLTKELHEIEEVLKPVKDKFEIIHFQGITLEILFNKFQEYKDRIAIFHFGGHADGYQLLLQSDNGGNQIIYGNGLVDFFSCFKDSLKIVFFNGCATENLAKNLVEIGIKIAIGTESTINDDVATRLAIRFYKGLANEHTIENAWKQAVSEIKASYKTKTDTRGLYRKGEEANTEKFAWEMICNDEIKVLKLNELIPKSSANIASINQQIAKASLELESVTSFFHGLSDSHITRKETYDLLQWVKNPLPINPNKPNEKPEPIALLVGEAGMGKSVIMKDLFYELKKENIPCLALKADRLAFENITLLKQELGLQDDIDKLLSSLADSHEKVVLLIDQIDALSQTLSSNRKPIELYLRIVSFIKNIPKIRIIVSCRNYDLKNDPDLEKYTGKQTFQVENLSKENVTTVFRQLNIDEKQLTDKLYTLLSKPLHLDIFCRVHDDITDFTTISTLQNLYDSLWKKIMIDKAEKVEKISFDKLYALIRDLADKMYEKQEISLQKKPYSDSRELKYLITEGLIQESEKSIQFFHQTFFDYVFAKSFVESGKILSKDLLQRPQNLFIRSQIKQVLNYLRDYDLDTYLNEVKILLSDEIYRFHIKLLVINQLGFQKGINRKEEQLVQNLVLSNSLFSNAFLESIENAEWLDLLQKTKLIDEIPNRDNEQELNITYKMFRRLLAKQPDVVLPILHDLTLKKVYQPHFLTGVLLNIKDFSQPLFPEVFNLLKPYMLQEREFHTYFHLLDESIKQIPEWAFDEFLNTFKEILELTKDSATKILNDQEFDFVKKLFQQNAHLGFDLALQIIHLLLAKTKYEYYADYVPKSSLRGNSAFSSYTPKSNDHDDNKQLLNLTLEYLEGLVSSDFDKVRLYIHDFLASQSLTLHILACELLRNNVSLFMDEVYNLITRKNYLYESNFSSDDLDWQIRDLIRQVFPILSDLQRQKLFEIISSLYFEEDKPNKERDSKGNRNHIGWYKRRIMNAIPEIYRKQHKELNKEFLELERRFGKLEDEKPRSRGVFRGYHGLKPKAYPKMSLDMWKKSFLKHNEKHLDLWNHKVNISGHSEVFKQEVKKNPAKFLKLIEEIIQDENINIQYRIRGLEGLKEGNHNPEEVKRLFKLFLTHIKDKDYIIQSIWFVDYFIQNQNVDKEIIEFLGNNALKSQDSGRWKNDGGALSVGINSIKGAAVHKLILCYFYSEVSDYIFAIVEKLAQEPTLPVRASIMYHLAWLNKLNKERSLNIFLTITRDFEPEILNVCGWSLMYMLHIDFEKLIPFFEKAITVESKEIQKIMAINLMSAWLGDYKGSFELFDKIISISEEAQHKILLEAFKYIITEEDKDKCEYIIRKFFDSESESIGRQYELGFLDANPTHFYQIYNLIVAYTQSKVGKYRGHYFYEYLLKCIVDEDTALKCLALVKDFNKHEEPNFQRNSLRDEPLQVVIKCYNTIRDYSDNQEVLEQILDVFDEVLKNPTYRNQMDEVLESI